jgi:predicted helicase
VFFKLSFGEAIRRSLLSDYRVVVIGVDDQTIATWIRNRELLITSTGYENDAESMGMQVGLLKGMRDYDLKRVISFHNKIQRAEQFSKELNAAAAWVSSGSDQAERVKSDYVSGEMPTFTRRQKLRDLKNLENADRRVLSNARCLAEGIDVPTLDGVAFIDPKSSQIEIIQAVGRAIRLSPDKKIGTIVIPVFLGVATELDPLIERGGFQAIWNVLNALKSHDEELGQR